MLMEMLNDGLTIKQCESRNKGILLNAIEWANERECDTIYYEDMGIICAYLDIRLTKTFHRNFISTTGVNKVKACGGFNTVFKDMDKVRKHLLKYDVSKLA